MLSHERIILEQLLTKMWIDYCAMNPAAEEIQNLFLNQGEKVINDHIALRTFNHPKLGIASLAQAFLKLGYKEKDDYKFEQKKLYAKFYQHPDSSLPKVFISELLLEQVSPFVRDTLSTCAQWIAKSTLEQNDFTVSGRQWPMSKKVYQELAKESEYASWVAAFGFRPNHFTVSVNALKNFSDLTQLNTFIETKGHLLNSSGGKIKGTPREYLEQSSTMAKEVTVKFDDGALNIPGCYYEFAKRYPMADGKIYQGFVATSADKIFESTNRIAA